MWDNRAAQFTENSAHYLAKELICLDALMIGQSNAINSSFASNTGWNGSVNSMKVDYQVCRINRKYLVKHISGPKTLITLRISTLIKWSKSLEEDKC
jgi:hypothetical protein